ncbi:MAG: chemotaxis protein CheA [Methanomicrobiales archaeon]|nr:chemotaxis protein CheA [Methanomicrobiales archaeon]
MAESDTYRTLYVTESRENHERLVQNLLSLEERCAPGTIDEIFRCAHTLKGMSASMGYDGMEQLCHAMEDVFHRIRSGQLPVQEPVLTLLLRCTDSIEGALDDIETTGKGNPADAAALVSSLRDLCGTAPVTAPPHPVNVLPPLESGQAEEGSPPSDEGMLQYIVEIGVAKDCTMRSVRGMLALQNLETMGRICSTAPSRENIEDGLFDEAFSVVIASAAGSETLRLAAGGPEITSVTVRECRTGDPTAMEGKRDPVPETVPHERLEKSREVKNIRVDIGRLDQMMNLVEDLVINRGRLHQIAQQHGLRDLDETLNMVGRSVADLQNIMMNIRMIPLQQIFNRFPRVVRDVAHHDGKEVEFVIEGGETELDRGVMDGLSDPLLHLIRNGVNHGIERPEERERTGKSRKGLLRLSAHRDRENVVIDIEDDGAGINEEKVRAKAVEKGICAEEKARVLTREEIIRLLFAPGFSTADVVTDISGRGVGLDVVRSAIEQLKGTIDVTSVPGKGTRFRLILPPTMAIIEVMMVRINGRRCAIPITNVIEVAHPKRGSFSTIGGMDAILLRDEVIPLYHLEDMFGRSVAEEIVIVLQIQNRKACICADTVEGQQEVVIKPLSRIIGSCRGIGGVTIPGDGEVVPVLDVATMV